MTSEPAVTEDAAASLPPAAPPAVHQTYLIGDNVYLRGPELGDARWTSAWRATPFPIAAQTAEEQLKKEVPEDFDSRSFLLIICRREDGRPLGSALIKESPHAVETRLTLHADPTLGAGAASVQAEALGLLLPWLWQERSRPVILLWTDIDLQPVVAAAERLGMRPAVRLREGVWRDGRLRDQMLYEFLHPFWVERLGDPGPGIASAGSPMLSPASPAPRRDAEDILTLPDNALLGSQRLALRPIQVDDAETTARFLREDPDARFGHPRHPLSPILLADWTNKLGAKLPPHEIELAIVLRESGALIGEVGLYDIDWLARHAESSTWLFQVEYRGSGYGTEAKHLLLEYAFERLGLHMIWSWVKSANPRSQAALRKQGYRDAGRLNWTGFGGDGFQSALMFDLLASEWRAARDGAG